MKFSVKTGRTIQFFGGLALFVIGVAILVRNIYVTTPFHTGQLSVGGIYIRSGFLIIPLLAGTIWTFFKPSKLLPKIIAIIGFLLIIFAAITSVTIRVGSISLIKWFIILSFIFCGIILVLRSLMIIKK